MTKEKKRILPIVAIVACMIAYCWFQFLSKEFSASWKHHLALDFFLAIILLTLRNIKFATVLIGIFLLLATFNFIALTAVITSHSFGIGPISTPPVQLGSLGLLILYFVLNMDILIDIYLDYKETH